MRGAQRARVAARAVQEPLAVGGLRIGLDGAHTRSRLAGQRRAANTDDLESVSPPPMHPFGGSKNPIRARAKIRRRGVEPRRWESAT